ncbi:MAG: hypothetical protein IJ535_06750 [Pseudobutyrivibrio sp.]|uniref:hypothetical protein n=1 Tax=Pseudobutyrivibrio sp. TaxID=2014367 RepID=UPI0025DC53FC|nr:hypothetical protein [Pseudobutyrivibrio sp.]MBQ8489465.1 hypothetical protein [Pseudobutyrivibrio sp.]
MKIKSLGLLISILSISFLFTGCGEPLMEMTAEEEAIITAYASKAVSKFNKNQTIGIANARVREGELDEEYSPDEPEEVTDDEALEQPEIDPETGEPINIDASSEKTEESGEESGEGTVEDSSQDLGYSFTEAIGIERVEFSCSEFDVSEEFKTKKFFMEKVSGKKYVVLSIEAKNTSDKSVDFSQYKDKSYSLSLNGKDKASASFTPLGNDLVNYDGILAAGDKKSLILVFQFSDSSVENITSMDLFVTSEGTTRGTTI